MHKDYILYLNSLFLLPKWCQISLWGLSGHVGPVQCPLGKNHVWGSGVIAWVRLDPSALLNLNMEWVYYSHICYKNSIQALFSVSHIHYRISHFHFHFLLQLYLTFTLYKKHKHIYLCIFKQAQDRFHVIWSSVLQSRCDLYQQDKEMALFLYSSKPQKHIFSLIDWLKGYWWV